MSTVPKDDGPGASPNGLGFRTRPPRVAHVNRKAAAIAVFALAAVGIAIVVGVVTRQPAATLRRGSGELEVPLEPAVAAGEQVAREIPDGNLAARRAEKGILLPGTGVLETPHAADPSRPIVPDAVAAAARTLPPPLPDTNQNPRTARATPAVDPAVERTRRLQEEREARLKQAMDAGTSPQDAGGGAGHVQLPVAPTPNAQPGTLQQALAGLQRPAAPLAAGLPPLREEDDPNKQLRKEQFLRDMEATPDRHFVRSTRTGALSRYEIKAGWNIPATMQHGINSDLPGRITALVSQNVFDTATGRHLLIPQGATLVGTYDSQVAYGQNGLLVVWRRIVFPDGSSLDLEGMGGVDEGGYGGLRDQTNNHYGRIVGFGLLTSLFSAAFQVSQNERQAVTGNPTASQTAGSAVAQQMSQLGIEIARRNLRIQPTLEIRPGYQFNVRVEKDLVFARPYGHGNLH